MAIKWKNGGEDTSVDIRPRPGLNWRVLDPNGSLDGPSGGGRARETLWGRGAKFGLQPRGIQYTGNPNDWTFNLTYPLSAQNFLDRLADCPFDVRARQRCGSLTDMVSYSSPGMVGYVETTNNDYSYDNPIAVMDGAESDVKRQIAGTATLQMLWTPVAHDDVTKDTSDANNNRVINIGQFKCDGNCGVGQSEEDKWLWVTDRDSTPGYSGNATPRLYYTFDRLVTRSSVAIDPFQLADATDVIFLGDRIVVFSPDKAPAYCSLQDILDGVTAPNLWSTMTGFSGITPGNFPRCASAPDSQTIYMVGAGGRIWQSTDGGTSTTLIDDGQTTTQNLNAVDFQDKDLGYIGGDSGVLLRYYKGAISRLTVADSNGILSANINTVRTPETRGAHVYAGTAGGEIWRSENATDTTPVWENLPLKKKGEGSITDIAFIGYRGDQMWYIHTNGQGLSRVVRDHSGGAAGTDEAVVGNYNTPANFGYNSIAMANVNMGVVVGNIHENFGFIGMIRPNT